MRWSMMSCKDVSAMVSRSMEENLSFRERMKVRIHLLFCDACSRFERQARFMDRAMKEYCGRMPDREGEGKKLPEDVRERIRVALREGKKP